MLRTVPEDGRLVSRLLLPNLPATFRIGTSLADLINPRTGRAGFLFDLQKPTA